MDAIVLGLFVFAAFAGGFASGLAGFAMGFIVSAIWLHILTPIQTAVLISGYSLWTQGYGVWKLRHALAWNKVSPFLIGGAVGVPIGAALLTWVEPAYMRAGVGLLLIAYGIFGLTQPVFKRLDAGTSADASAGLLNGILCGMTGLPGFIITIWCQLRGWTKDVQRSVFQPVMLAASTMTAISLGIGGAITAEVVKLYLLGLPAMLSGLWIGFKLYGKLDEAMFRKLLLVLLMLSGCALAATQIGPLLRPGLP